MTRTELAAFWPPTASAAREAGHKSQSPLQAICEKCRDCSCHQLNEIRACEAPPRDSLSALRDAAKRRRGAVQS